jgi:hypothetical protein
LLVVVSVVGVGVGARQFRDGVEFAILREGVGVVVIVQVEKALQLVRFDPIEQACGVEEILPCLFAVMLGVVQPLAGVVEVVSVISTIPYSCQY